MKLRTLLLGLTIVAAAFTASAQSPKYVFYYIGDGMGMGPVMAAETYNRTILNNPEPLLMFRFPVVGWCTTYSANSNITDSAAAGTALSTGHKTKNGMLGMAPDTTNVYSVALDLQRLGYGIGIATSVAPDDATPGAFYAHVAHRSMFETIDRQMAESGYQFLAGSDLRGTMKDGKDNGVFDLFKKNKVQIVRGLDGVKEIKSGKVKAT